MPAPFVPDGNFMNFAIEPYLSGASVGELRGWPFPNVGPEEGYELAPGGVDGYIGMEYVDTDALDTCTKSNPCKFSYVDGRGSWAHYGYIGDLSCMPQSGLEFIECNWFTGDEVLDLGADAECHLEAYWTGSKFVGVGNMATFLDFIGK
jgi:hypothetical protein